MPAKVSSLEKRAQQLKAQLEAAQNRLKEEKRKTSTRRKIILGAAVLSAIEQERKAGGCPGPLESRVLRFVSQKDKAFLESCE